MTKPVDCFMGPEPSSAAARTQLHRASRGPLPRRGLDPGPIPPRQCSTYSRTMRMIRMMRRVRHEAGEADDAHGADVADTAHGAA